MRSLVVLCLTLPLSGLAQTGVSDDRVSLPEGPGSLEGVGDNAAVTGNMGAMTYGVPIEVVKGFPDATPALSLDYNSMSGNSVVGMGFSFTQPFVERFTNRGLPRYDDSDVFVFGGEELVRLDDGEPARYRARFEKGFARYHWHERFDDGGFWRVELANGVVQFFGATPAGERVGAARVEGGAGVFRWHLVEARDRFGHRMVADYIVPGGLPYLSRLDYVFTAGPPAASVTFDYEPREDLVADARSGREEVTDQRLVGVTAWAEGEQFRRYALAYEPYDTSGGLSRLASVEQFGVDDAPLPIRLSFSWSTALGGVCVEACEAPLLVHMGAIGANLGAGNATLIDINGDALPDMVDTSQPGPHRIHLGRLAADGRHDFARVVESEVGDRAGHELASPYTQTLDADGDGRADLVNVRTGEVLYNGGTGDWSREALEAVGPLPDFGEEFAVGAEELTHVRFLDYDNDRRIDVVRSSEIITQIYANRGADGFALDEAVENIGAGFADQRLEFSDLNGDGLLDPVLLRPGELSYRANLGYGRWSEWRLVDGLPFNDAEIDSVELEDLNGDSLDDLVLVLADEVRFALNRGGQRFDAPAVIRETDEGPLPQRVDQTTVLFADMNGSGSDDVVWVTAAGDVTYLELFPLRPNLLTRVIDNYGVQTDVEYVTAAQLQARTPWARTPPFAMAMVAGQTTTDPLTELTETTHFDYRDGYYDPEEKQFRGFSVVERVVDGDAHHDGLRRVERYELGADDPYRAGLLLGTESYAEGDDAPLQTEETEYADCELAGVAGLERPVRHLCRTAQTITLLEGADADEHAVVRTTWQYDAWGNATLTSELGVTEIGAGCGACDPELVGRPCGGDCAGDELFIEREYVAPNAAGPWIVGLVSRERKRATANGAQHTETQTYYDGEAFTGLPLGEATLGLPTRIVERVDADRHEPALRGRYDADGNLVVELSPIAPGPVPGYRMYTDFDPTGLDVVGRRFEVVDGDGFYTLQRTFEWDPTIGRMSASSDWFVAGVGAEPGWARYGYDALGRITATSLPGDRMETATTQFEYDFSGPVSKVIRRDRTVRNSRLPDREHVQCFDSAGRKFQDRVFLGPGRYQVVGHKVFDVRGRTAREYMDHVTDTRDCEIRPPQVPSIVHRYDALGRALSLTMPDADLYGTASVSRSVYRPLARWSYDAEDSDPESDFFDTPTVVRSNGRDQTVSIEYPLGGDEVAITRFGYDGVGRVVAVRDPEGNRRTQVRDGRGRIVEFDDEDRGTTLVEYDAAGRVLRSEDATGVALRHAYGSLGRRIATWDEADPEGTRAEFQYDRADGCPPDLCAHPAEAMVGARYPVAGVPVQVWYSYDDRRRLDLTRHELGEATIETRTEYDNLGEVAAEHFPGGVSLTYERDGKNRAVAIEGLVDAIEYTEFSEVSGRTFANGVAERHDFNTMRQTVRRVIEGAAGPLVDLGYLYNRMGHVTEVRDGLAGRFPGAGLGARYAYDALYRLTEAELDHDVPAQREVLSYAYGLDGRLLRRSSSRGEASALHVGEYRYGEDGAGPHAVTGAGDLRLAYDAAGRVRERGAVRFERDHTGRIVIARRGEETIATFGYTPNGRRMWRGEGAHFAWELGRGLEIEDGMLLVHAILGEQRVATTETDAVAAEFLPDGNDDGVIDAGDAVVAGGDATERRRILASSVRRGLLEGQSRETFYHYDHLRSVAVITDADGEVVERRAYAPYGAARTPDSGAETTYGHSAKRTDRSTGLADFGARDYDAFLGRWTAPDPAFLEINAARIDSPIELTDAYGYSLGNPVNFYDPDGGKTTWGMAGKWAVKAGVVLGGTAVGLATGGASNIAAAAIGASGAFTGAVAKEVAYFKAGNAKVTKKALVGASLRVLATTAGGFLAGGFLGVGWAGVEWGRAALGAGIAYKGAKTRSLDGLGTSKTTKWDVAGMVVDYVTPAVSTPAVAALGAAQGVYTFLAHRARKKRSPLMLHVAQRKRGRTAKLGARALKKLRGRSLSRALSARRATPSRKAARPRPYKARAPAKLKAQ